MATATITGPEQVDEGRVEGPGVFTTRSPEEVSRRRFTIAVVTGTALTLPFTLWLLWDLWSGKVNVIRGVSFDYFYDRQARAMFHGHLWVPNGQLSIEAFVHDGHQFTYFGVFPSLIRMPILLFTSRLDGDLTAPSLLLAWFATAVFTALLLWRLRVFIRGNALVGRADLDATILRQPLFRDAHVGHDLDAADQRGLQLLRRIGHLLQHAVDAVAQPQPLFQRLDVNIGRALIEGRAHDLVDETDHGRFGILVVEHVDFLLHVEGRVVDIASFQNRFKRLRAGPAPGRADDTLNDASSGE